MTTRKLTNGKLSNVLNRRPTLEDGDGSYSLIDDDGLYWGEWYVGRAWHGERFVAPASSHDGLPC